MKKTKKLRVNYSLLKAWEEGDIDRAVSTYFHIPGYTSKAMEQGSKIHEEIEEHIKKEGRLPDYMPNFELNEPEPEQKLIVEYNDRFNLSCIVDCLDIPTAYEWKTGVTDALAYTHYQQIPITFLACELAGHPIEKVVLAHYNQHEDKKDWVVFWNSKSIVNQAKNYIDSLAPEIDKYFRDEGLI